MRYMRKLRSLHSASEIWVTLPITILFALTVLVCCSSEEQAAEKGDSTTSALPDISQTLPGNEIAGYAAIGDAETYSRQDVWDYLHQPAEKYLSNGFTQMVVQRYRKGSDTIVVEISQFGEKRNAYAIYSSDRAVGAGPVEVDADGYLQDRSVHLTKDRYAAVVRGTGDTDDASLIAVAAKIAAGIEGEPFVHPHAKFLPVEGMIPNTYMISLIDNEPHNERPDFISALYVTGNDTMRVYLQYYSRLGMTFAAEEFLDAGGKVDQYIMGGKYQSLTGSSPQLGPIYCAVDGTSVCAVTGFSDLEHAKAMANRVLEGLPKR